MNGTDLREAVATLLGVAHAKVQIERQSARAYSKNAVVSVTADQGLPRRYFVKQARGSLQRQHELLTKANAAIRLPYFHRLESFYDGDNNLLVIDLFEGAPLRDIILHGPLLGSATFRTHLSGLFERAGAWLRAFHEIEKKIEDGRPACHAAFDRRIPKLHARFPDLDLSRLADSACLAEISTSLSHGDFMPQNILFGKDGVIAVIDYGIRDWQHMSPAWDIRTFTVGVGRLLHESRMRELRGLGLGLEKLEVAFLQGYDEQGPHHGEDRIVTAMRHASFLYGHVTNQSETSRAARWHLNALRRAMAPGGQQPSP